jgi:hypothetical protein
VIVLLEASVVTTSAVIFCWPDADAVVEPEPADVVVPVVPDCAAATAAAMVRLSAEMGIFMLMLPAESC